MESNTVYVVWMPNDGKDRPPRLLEVCKTWKDAEEVVSRQPHRAGVIIDARELYVSPMSLLT